MGGVRVFDIWPWQIPEHYGVGFMCNKYDTQVSNLVKYLVVI